MKETTQCTPGPWGWHSALHDDGRNNGSVIANIETGRAECVCKAPQYESGPQWEANAQLIAAAPDLLEALEQMVEMFGTGAPAPEPGTAVFLAREAIDKATGTKE